MSLIKPAFSLLIALAITAFGKTRAQQNYIDTIPGDSIPSIRLLDINPRYFQSHDTVWRYSGICKTLKIVRFTGQDNNFLRGNTDIPRRPFLTVRGNIQYDFLYRSFADTPYYQKDFRQHTLQSSVNITVKDKYSFHFNLMLRQSNSPYFKNFLDGGLQFDKNALLMKLKQQAENKIISDHFQKPDLQLAEAALKEQQRKYDAINHFLNKPDLAQRIIEEREKRYYPKLKTNLSRGDNKTDSTISRVENFIAGKRHELDSLQSNISRLTAKADSLRNVLNNEAASVRQKVYNAKNIRELDKVAAENGLTDEKKEKWEKVMCDIRSIGIGRTVLNYSELTVNNVSLTGINIEYNPGVYAAVAAGKIDYGFRDFFGRNNPANKQNLLMGRFGLGNLDKKAIIFSVFTGRKYNYGSVLNDTVNGCLNITGYAIEGIMKKNENAGMSIEIAKSTRPLTGNLRDNKESAGLFEFSDNSNQGLSIKGQTIIPETNTRFSGFFRKTGKNFQSFSLFTYNTDQTAWLLKADQSFLRKRVNLTAMLRRNDFTNPFTEKTFKTTTVFTSAQLNIQFPKWPSVSAGYFPGSQLYIIDRVRVRENVYYILNGSIIHNYSLWGIKMLSSFVYNRFSNKGTDSGFISYNGTSYLASHSLLFRKLQLQGNFIYTDQPELKFYTLEANGDYSPVTSFRIGGGAKFNKIPNGKTCWGGTAQIYMEIKKLGGLQLQYEKSFLPTIYQTLFPVETGRLTWFKYF